MIYILTPEQKQSIQAALEVAFKQAVTLKNDDTLHEALTIVESLKSSESVACIAMINEDHFNDVCSRANGNSSTQLYALRKL